MVSIVVSDGGGGDNFSFAAPNAGQESASHVNHTRVHGLH